MYDSGNNNYTILPFCASNIILEIKNIVQSLKLKNARILSSRLKLCKIMNSYLNIKLSQF